ncbi:hypothetical protein Hanom_Chr07g00617051 [Helianthus anomalus]
MCYNQATSMLWRVLYTLEHIISEVGLDFNLSELSRMTNCHTPKMSHRTIKRSGDGSWCPLISC